MPTKRIDLTVEVHVEAVTCPGVWLCPDGKVSLLIFALDSSHQTTRLPPNFPLPYRDVFYFRKTFPNSCSLANIQSVLKDETVYCELVQWKSKRDGSVLAQYLGALADVLFPPDTCTTDGVDLLMKNANVFPGILSPKIEVSTKVRVDEVYEGSSGCPDPQPCPGSAVGDSAGADVAAEFRRQKPVCHSKLYHKNRCCCACQKSRGKTSQTRRSGDERLKRDCSCGCSLSCEHCKDLSRSRPNSPYIPASPSPSSPVTPLPHITTRTALHSPMMHFNNEDRLQTSWETDEERYGSGTYVPRGRSAVTAWNRETDLNEGHVRVARSLESNYTGARGRLRARYDSGGGWAETALVHHHRVSGSGPCVCEICRRYHQLFHVN